MPKVKAIFEEY